MKKLIVIVAALLTASMIFAAEENLLKGGDMESGAVTSWVAEGSSLSFVQGQGINGSTALYVRGQYNWSGAGKDITSILDINSDYYVELWFKADPKDKQNRKAEVSLCLQPEGVDDYDAFAYLSLDPAEGKYTGGEGVGFTNKEFTKVSGIITSETMKEALSGKKCVNATFYFKSDNPLRPFYLDNVKIIKQ